jgi:AraC-like DNA-binding protein
MVMKLHYVKQGFIQGNTPALDTIQLHFVSEWAGARTERSEEIRFDSVWILDTFLEGSILIELDGNQYEMYSGIFHLYPPGTSFFEGPSTDFVRNRYIMFKLQDNAEIQSKLGNKSHFAFRDPEHILLGLTDKVFDLYEMSNGHISAGLHGLMLLIVHYLTHASKTASDEHAIICRRNTNPFVIATNNLLSKDLNTSVCMESIATKLNVSVSTLFHKYKGEVGISPYQARIGYRLNMVKQLLTSDNMTLDAIAEETGFYNTAHLSRTFKKHEGVTPSDYRKLIREAKTIR